MSSTTAPAAPQLDERREALLAVALEQIRAVGPGASMEQIAVAAGVTKPTLYRTFGSKNGLYAAVVDHFVAQLQSDIVRRFDAELGVRDVLRAVIEVVLVRIRANEPVYHFMMRRARMALTTTDDDQPDFLVRLGETATRLIAQRFELSGLPTRPAPLYGQAVVGFVSAAADWWLAHPDVPMSVVVEDLVDLLYVGFQMTDPEASPPVTRAGA
ncbi:MAG: TetR/AcrR family transcriptional regulator [Acidimicrobiales bacterium]|nr:TetR/AcrR family transcriptional regulator [Acidimicrobiales bacterium]